MGLCGWGGAEVCQDGFHSIKRKRKLKEIKITNIEIQNLYMYTVSTKNIHGFKIESNQICRQI